MLRTFASVALLSFQLNAAPLLLSGHLTKDVSQTKLAINKKIEGDVVKQIHTTQLSRFS